MPADQQVHPEVMAGEEGPVYDAAIQNPAMARDVGFAAGKYRGAHCVQMKETKRIMKASSWWFVFAASTSLLGMVIGVAVAELDHFEDLYDAKRTSLLAPLVLTLKFCIAVATAATITALIFYYNGMVELAKLKGLFISPSANFLTRLGRAGLLEEFAYDVAAHLIFPWPFVHFEFQIWDQVIHQSSTYVPCNT